MAEYFLAGPPRVADCNGIFDDCDAGGFALARGFTAALPLRRCFSLKRTLNRI